MRRARDQPAVELTEAERIAALEEEVRILTGRRETEEAHEEARVALALVGPNGHRQPSALAQQAAKADAALVAARVTAHEAAVAETERRREADAGPRGRLEERIAALDGQHTEALAAVAAAQARADDIERQRGIVSRQLGERELSYRVEPEPIPADAAHAAAMRGEHTPADNGRTVDSEGREVLRSTIRRILPHR